MTDVIVLGAGIVGVSAAIHLARRGRSVLLVDRCAPGRETSFGNAGLIQREAVRPYAFPRSIVALLRIARNTGTEAHYHPSALPGYASALAQYWWHSAPTRYRQIVASHAQLIAHSVTEHADLIVAAGAENLIRRDGYIELFRSPRAFDAAAAQAEADAAEFGVQSRILTRADVAQLEPDLKIALAGSVQWTQPWTVTDPGALVAAYARHFVALGGTIGLGDAAPLRQTASGWQVVTDDGPAEAAEVVLALGPWAHQATWRLGYRLPMFIERGYHQHYGVEAGARLRHWVFDAEPGYVLAPMDRGIRLTSGAEFAALSAPPTPVQLDRAEAIARDLFPLGQRLDPAPWMGARPCTPDMKPIIGAAPRHLGLWFAFGHGHHGLTLGPATGRLLAETMTGEPPFLDLAPYGAARFLR